LYLSPYRLLYRDRMTMSLGSSTSINAQLYLGIIGAIAFGALVIWLLIEIELSIIFKAVPEKRKKSKKKADVEEEEGTFEGDRQDNNVASDEPAGESPRPRKLDRNQKLIIIAKVATIVLLAYLLLVFLPSGLWLSLIGLSAVIFALLRVSIIEEHRRQRYDRLAAIVTLILLIASSASIATYARLAAREGPMYEGPARIVGYDDTSYYNDGDNLKRTDLEVSWGGEWACPETGKYCAAFVNGALCEVDEDAYNDDDARRLDENNEDANENEDQNEQVEEDYDGDEENEEELEEENEEVEEANEELEEENEELQEEVEELEEENEELQNYYFEDDVFGDDYWVTDWSSIWGDYACYDLFDTDLEGMEYDSDTPPGDDGWPFVNIYGSCKSCTAYLVDYYSTEFFQKITSYQTQARNYLIAGFVGLSVTLALVVKERVSPSNDNELTLISNEGGMIA